MFGPELGTKRLFICTTISKETEETSRPLTLMKNVNEKLACRSWTHLPLRFDHG